MTPEQDLNLQRWICALRTTKISQGVERLFVNGTIPKACCLGIACEVFQVPYYEIPYYYEYPHYGRSYEFDNHITETANIPLHIFQQAFGLSRKDQDILMELNDVLKWPFSKIADWLEQFRLASLGIGDFPINPFNEA